MKLTNLSLAILVAVGVAACGGSGDDNSNKPADPPKPNPNQPNNNNNQPTPPANDDKVVDPTGTQVVDDKDLTKQNTVGTLQYIRREGSQYDRTLNPSKPASASPLLGTTLNDQNPSLTNIVLARQEIVRTDGTPVKAQFAGSDNPVPLKANGDAIPDSVTDGNSLQEENFKNVDTLIGMYFGASHLNRLHHAGHHEDDGTNVDGANNVDLKNKIKRESVFNTEPALLPDGTANPDAGKSATNVAHRPYVEQTASGTYKRVDVTLADQDLANQAKVNNRDAGSEVDGTNTDTSHSVTGKTGEKIQGGTDTLADATKGVFNYVKDEVDDPANPGSKITRERTYTVSDAKTITAVIDPYAIVRNFDNSGKVAPVDGTDPKAFKKIYSKDVEGNKDVYMYRGSTPKVLDSDKVRQTVTPDFAHGTNGGTRYGRDLVWWTTPEYAFENDYTREGKTDTYFENGLFATNGLIRVGNSLSTLGQELNWNKDEKKWENHHNTTTRIFGRYHLAYAGTAEKNKGIHPVALNSFSGAKSFVAEYETEASDTDRGTANDKAGKATLYSIGAVPMTLKYVQYGRVSTQLDVDEGVKGYADNFIRNPYKAKNADDSVDDYFYRGTNATTIEQMAALPSDQKATYQGHALMYGIDNDFHNAGKRNLPNAFAGKTDGLGLGNFVEATADFGTKRLQGNVYNEWLLDQTKSTTTRDNLVAFQGNIVGNTVVGTADRTYLAGDDKATFKASFFGEKAEELGGSFNSVKDADKYGSAYGENDWGGVFGATRGGTSNTFQGDDSNNVYGNNQQNGQQP